MFKSNRSPNIFSTLLDKPVCNSDVLFKVRFCMIRMCGGEKYEAFMEMWLS